MVVWHTVSWNILSCWALATCRDDCVGWKSSVHSSGVLVPLKPLWYTAAFHKVGGLQKLLVLNVVPLEVCLNRGGMIWFSFLDFRSVLSSGCRGCTLFDLSFLQLLLWCLSCMNWSEFLVWSLTYILDRFHIMVSKLKNYLF